MNPSTDTYTLNEMIGKEWRRNGRQIRGRGGRGGEGDEGWEEGRRIGREDEREKEGR